MTDQFFSAPILNSPYEAPARHWELDKDGQPTQRIIESRRKADFITPIPKAKKRGRGNLSLALDEGGGLSTADQSYLRSLINELRVQVERWRALSDPSTWNVTPETARLLQHWRHHKYNDVRPFTSRVGCSPCWNLTISCTALLR